MPASADSGRLWDARIARAHALIPASPAAAEALTFYAALASFQKKQAASAARGSIACGASSRLQDRLDLDAVLDVIPKFLSWLPLVAPARLAESAIELQKLERPSWDEFLRTYLASVNPSDMNDTQTFVLESVLQPFAEMLAVIHTEDSEGTSQAASAGHQTTGICPFCSALPVTGVLRESGQGARRSLLCGLCLTERAYLRVVCPSCGEEQFDELPVYTADRFAHVRIEACDRCRRYLKTIDLTSDGLAVPLVDDLASVSLDLWARERGYVRLAPNLLRL